MIRTVEGQISIGARKMAAQEHFRNCECLDDIHTNILKMDSNTLVSLLSDFVFNPIYLKQEHFVLKNQSYNEVPVQRFTIVFEHDGIYYLNYEYLLSAFLEATGNQIPVIDRSSLKFPLECVDLLCHMFDKFFDHDIFVMENENNKRVPLRLYRDFMLYNDEKIYSASLLQLDSFIVHYLLDKHNIDISSISKSIEVMVEKSKDNYITVPSYSILITSFANIKKMIKDL